MITMEKLFNPSKEKQVTLHLKTGKPEKVGVYIVIYYHYPKNRAFRSYDQFKSFRPYNCFDILAFGKKTAFDIVDEWHDIVDLI